MPALSSVDSNTNFYAFTGTFLGYCKPGCSVKGNYEGYAAGPAGHVINGVVSGRASLDLKQHGAMHRITPRTY